MRCYPFHKIFSLFLMLALVFAAAGQNINNMRIAVSSESLTVLKFNSRITHVEFGNRDETYTSQVRDDDNSLVIKTSGDTAVNTNLYVTEGKRGHLFNVVYIPVIDINNTKLYYDFSDLKKLKKIVSGAGDDVAANTTPGRPDNNTNTVSEEDKRAQYIKDSAEAAEAKKKADAEVARQAKIKADSVRARKEEDARLAKARADAEAAQKAEEQRLAKAKADADAAQKAEDLRLVKAKADAEAVQKAEELRLAKAKADAEAAQKAEELRLAKAKANAEAAQKVEEQRVAKAQADADAAQKLQEEKRLAKEKADAEAEQQKLVKVKADSAAAKKIQEEKIAKAKAADEEAKRAEEARQAKAKSDSIQKEYREQLMQARIDSIKRQKARSDSLAKVKLDLIQAQKEENARLAKQRADSIQAQKERNALLAKQRADSIQAAKEEAARVAKARLDSIQARRDEIVRLAALRKKQIEDSLAAIPKWYTHTELWKKYPRFTFEDPPNGQHLAGDYFLVKDTLENATISYAMLKDSAKMSLSSNVDNGVHFTLQNIAFYGVNCYMRIHIENGSKADYLTGIMNLRWNTDSGKHYDAYPCFITSYPSEMFRTSFPVLAGGVDRTIVLTTRALNVKEGDSLLLTIGDRLYNTELELAIPVKDYLSIMEHTK